MKKICISVGIVLIGLIAMGIITNYIDSGRVTTGHEPKYCIKIVNNDGSKVTYWGLGYKVIRYVGVSPNEPYENNIGVKMGSWFMRYDARLSRTRRPSMTSSRMSHTKVAPRSMARLAPLMFSTLPSSTRRFMTNG